MATFDIENNVFIKALTLNSQSSVLALSTAGKFVNRNISVQITAKSGSARTPATSITQNPEITLTTATGAIQATYTKTQSIIPSVTEGWVSTGTSGMITTAGNTSITLPASTATVTDNSITIQPGWFGATTALTVTSGSASTPATTIAKAPTISVATATGVVTARYNSSKSITPTVVAGWVSSGTAGTVSTTGNATLTLPIAGVSVSGKTINITPGWIGATTGYDVQTVSMTSTNATISGSTFNQGFLSVPTGWVTATTANRATFTNTGSSNTTYLDISDTTGAPVLVSGDYLYINKGYTDNLRISLAKLIPDGASVLLADSHILSGYSAYNNNGVLVAGSIPTKDVSDITISTNNIIVPSGYYPTTATEMIDEGDYTAGVSLSSVTVTPSVTISNASTYGFTTTEPSSGTYITVDPSANNPTYTATGTASIIEAGYLGLGNKNTSVTKTVAVAAGTNYYAPVITPTFSGGGLTVNTNTNTVSTNAVVTISATGTFASASTYGVTTTKPSGTDGTAFLSIDSIGAVTTTGVVTSSVKMTRAQVNYTNKAGVATTHTNATAVNATSTTTGTTARVVPTVTDNFAARYIPIVTPTFNGGGLTTNTHTNVVTTAPNVTLSATGTLVNATAYGVTTTQPASGNYKTIDVYATAINGQAKSEFKVTRATSNFSVPAGAIAQYDNVKTLNGASNTGTQSVAVTPTVTDNFDTLYIPVIDFPQINWKTKFSTAVHAITATPVVTVSTTGTFFTNTSTYGITTTKPSGTDGTAYLTLDGKGIVSTTGYSYARFTADKDSITWADDYQGLVNFTMSATMGMYGSAAVTATSVAITPTITDNFATHYIPIVSTTFSGGGLSVSSTNAITTNMATTSTSDYYIDAVATITATRAQVNYNNAAGAIAAHSGATAIAVSRSNTSTSATRIYVPQATFSTTYSLGQVSVNATSTNIETGAYDAYRNNIILTATAVVGFSTLETKAIQAGYSTTGAGVIYFQNEPRHANKVTYIKGVTLNKPASGEAKFSITVPNGSDDMITFVFHVDSSGNVVVNDSTANAFS